MSGDDEVRVRATLVEMQQRISKGPHNALGVSHTASHEDVRAAFLALTKRFHPAKFARMSNDLQKFSNEVFLGIRSAHDTLVNGSSLRTGATKSGAFFAVAEGSGSARTATPASTLPLQKPIPRPGVTLPAGSRQPTPLQGQPALRPTPLQGQPTLRPSSPAIVPSTRAQSPAAPAPARLTGAMDEIAPQTLRYNESQKSPAAAFDERTALEHAIELVNAKSWAAARQALHTLAARVPQSKHYRALLCYTRGREAQAANRPEEAVLEFQRALQLDPELAQAKQAVSEIQRRR